MKKVHTINLNQTVFHIDEDAYQRLHSYMETQKEVFQQNNDENGILRLEKKLASHFSGCVHSLKQVITLEDVEKVLELLANEGNAAESEKPQEPTEPRRLYRDMENAIVGGICAGFSHFMGWDVTWIRIVLVLLSLLSFGNIFIIYVILWFVIPKARTEDERKAMRKGQGGVNAEYIKQEAEHLRDYVASDKFRNNVSISVRKLIVFFTPALRFLAGFIGLLAGVLAIVFVVALATALFAFFFRPDLFQTWGISNFHQVIVFNSYESWWFFCSLILMGISTLLTVIFLVSFVVKGRVNRGLGKLLLTLIIFWLMGLILYFSYSGSSQQWMESLRRSSLIESPGQPVFSDQRGCSDFQKIEVESMIDMVIIQDSIEEVKVVAPENIQSHVVTKVSDGVLSVYSKGIFFQNTATVYVKVKQLNSLHLSGASSVVSQNLIKAQNMQLMVSGAAEANLTLEIENALDVKASGAADLQLLGYCKNMNLMMSGTSSLNARGMKAQQIEVETSGTSDAQLFAVQTLKAFASGASEIECIGNPRIMERTQQGGAEIRIR